MADKSIFELNLQTTFAPNDRLVVGNYANSDAEAITGQQLTNLLAIALDGHGGIASIAKTSSSGTNPVVDTYTVTFADTTTTTFTVTNGIKGDTGAQTYVWLRWAHTQPTSWSDTTSNPDDWMGIYTGLSSTQPTTVSSYAWYEVKGEKGDTGDPASVVSTAVEYQTSDSGTVIPIGTWSSTVPAVAQGEFLWTRTTLTFNSGSPIISYAVSYAGIDGQGSPSSATPQMDSGNGSAGIGTSFSRDDHIHPTDTSRLAIDGTSASVWSSNTNNLNNFLSGVVLCSSSVVNAPYANWAFIVASGTSGTVLQTAYALFNDFVPMQRHCAAGTWSAWQPIGLEDAGTITLSTSWSGSDPFYQTVTVSGATVTANSKVDLQPSETQLATLADAGVTALVIKNNNGTLTAYALGASLSSSMTIQCTVTEVIA